MNIKQKFRTYFTFSIAILLAVMVIIIIIFFFRGSNSLQSKLPTDVTISVTPVLPEERTYGTTNIPLLSTLNKQLTTNQTIPLDKSNSIQVKDFANTATKREDGSLLLVDVPQSYNITYTPTTAKFQINVTGKDFNSLRNTAEQNLLTTLGISSEQACKLNIGVDVDYTVNPYYSSVERQPKFCLTSDQIKEDQIETSLSNNLPKSDQYAVSAYYISTPTNHFQFQVVLQGSDTDVSKQAFLSALASQGLTTEQINKLDILYTGPIGSFQSDTNSPASTLHD